VYLFNETNSDQCFYFDTSIKATEITLAIFCVSPPPGNSTCQYYNSVKVVPEINLLVSGPVIDITAATVIDQSSETYRSRCPMTGRGMRWQVLPLVILLWGIFIFVLIFHNVKKSRRDRLIKEMVGTASEPANSPQDAQNTEMAFQMPILNIDTAPDLGSYMIFGKIGQPYQATSITAKAKEVHFGEVTTTKTGQNKSTISNSR